LSDRGIRQMNASSIRNAGLPLDERRIGSANPSSSSAAPRGLEQRGNAAKPRGDTLDLTPPAWRGGIKEAHRHSARVRMLRGTAAAGSALALALILGAALHNPLTHLPADFSVKRVGLDGTKITVDFPKITAFRTMAGLLRSRRVLEFRT